MDFTTIIKTVAPWIGTALGGPLAGLAIEAAGNALGLADKTTDALKATLAGTVPPTADQLLALKTADQQFALQMQALDFKSLSDLEGLAVADRKDARAMQVATNGRMPAALAIVITLGFFGLLDGMAGGFLSAQETPSLSYMLGSLNTAWTGAMAFYFGSTRDSGRKTELLAQAPATGQGGK